MHMRYYDASVVFYKNCLMKLRQKEMANTKIAGIFRNDHISSLNSKKAEYLLNKAIEKHDSVLQKDGQLSRIHRCNNKPYRHNISRSPEVKFQHDISPIPFNTSEVWNFDARRLTEYKTHASVVEVKMVDKLCSGGQLKVRRGRSNRLYT